MLFEIVKSGGETFRINLAHVTCIARRPDDGSKEPNVSISLTGGAAPYRFTLTREEYDRLLKAWEAATQH